MSSMRAELSPTEEVKLLRDLWVAHDGRWFLGVAAEFGFDVANKLNMSVIRSMGKKEAKELMVRTGAQIANADDVRRFLEMGGELYWPENHKTKIEFVGDSVIRGRILSCYVWDNVRRGGGLSNYRCAAVTRFRGWVDAFGVPGKVTGSSDVDACNGSCEITFEFDWTAGSQSGSH